MEKDAFESSLSLANWSANVLKRKKLDEVSEWRMLEYWMQIELYRAIQSGSAGLWRHIGDYEQPYYTDQPKSGSKTKTKWIDLVIGEPNIVTPNRVVWIELKDLGRNGETVLNNSKALGGDLAALWSLRLSLTQEIWLNPPSHAIDHGRLQEWKELGPGISIKDHFISQIVLCHKSLSDFLIPEQLIKNWLRGFEKRAKDNVPEQPMSIKYSETDKFFVFALIANLNKPK